MKLRIARPDRPSYRGGHTIRLSGAERPFDDGRDRAHRIQLVLGDTPHEGVQRVAVGVLLFQDSDCWLDYRSAIVGGFALCLERHWDRLADDITVMLEHTIRIEPGDENVAFVRRRQKDEANRHGILISSGHHNVAPAIDGD